MRYSYSNVSTAESCPYKWWLTYKDKLKTIPEQNPDNALYLGLALHKGIEDWSVESALEEYKSHYNIITDQNVNWMIQLECQVPKVLEVLPKDGEHEIEVMTDDFVGYVDYVVGDTIYDFKFSNNIDKYLQSPQLSIYKYYLTKVRPTAIINHIKFVFVPKSLIRQKKTETLEQFRMRLVETLDKSEVQIIEVPYNEQDVIEFQEACKFLETITSVNQCPKNVTRLCDWCQFKQYCESDGNIDYMILEQED